MNYDDRERMKTNQDLAALGHEPLKIRQENRAEYARAMNITPEIVAERIEWMIEGCYGHGAYLICQDILKRTRMNRIAMLSQMIAGLEWHCSALESRKAYLTLTKAGQARIDKAIQAIIDRPVAD